jgi:uncharacterized protein (DUF952 family)
MSSVIYHLVPVDYWEAQPADQPYLPADFEREGFIHCTRGADQVAIVANRYYRNDRREWLVLVLDEQAVTSEIKYEPGHDGLFYPHIYGPLNREAICEALRAPRDADGTFRSPSHS